jgi:hypothetical protein
MIAQRPIERTVPPTHVMGIARFERFFRAAAGLDVDKEDLKRYADFINRKIRDLLIRGEAVAKANGRDFIQPVDLPITKGMQESIDRFKEIDETIELRPILDRLIANPPLDLDLGEETEAELYAVGGGLSLALARTFKIIDPDLKNPQARHWERSFQIFDLLLSSRTCASRRCVAVVRLFSGGLPPLPNLHDERWREGLGLSDRP